MLLGNRLEREDREQRERTGAWDSRITHPPGCLGRPGRPATDLDSDNARPEQRGQSAAESAGRLRGGCAVRPIHISELLATLHYLRARLHFPKACSGDAPAKDRLSPVKGLARTPPVSSQRPEAME